MPLGERREFLSDVISRASAVRVRNVMNPLLWLNAVTVPALLTVSVLLKDHPWLAGLSMLGALAIPAGTFLAYGYFAVRDPQRLQSEEFVLLQQRLMIESKTSNEPIDATTIGSGSNSEPIDRRSSQTRPRSPAQGPVLPSSLEENNER